MFKYDEFPILKIQVYDSEGVLHNKKFRLKSHQPYFTSSTHLLINIIDFETSEHLTLKKVFKTKDLSKDNTLAEIYNQSKMRKNENFIQIKQVYEDHDFIYLLMEPTQISLQQILKNRVRLFQRQVQYIFCQLVTILQCLRRNNIFHGNITLSNLYLEQKTKKVKLSGFGHSIDMEKINQNMHTNLYTYEQINSYLAPQLFDSNVQSAYLYYGGDIWAVGVVIYTLLYGYQPFINIDDAGIKSPCLTKIKNYSYKFPKSSLNIGLDAWRQPCRRSTSISQEWKQLLKHIFIQKQHRIRLSQLIQHPLNHITQSKFIDLECCDMYVPTLDNNFISSMDCNLDNVGLCQNYEQLFNFNPNSNDTYCNGQNNISSYTNTSKQISNPSENKNLSKPPSLLTNNCQSIAENPTGQKQLLTGGQINTSMLKLLLLQNRKCTTLLQPPLVCQRPSYIQKYCYIQQHKCIGYVVDNIIGVVYADGSCIIGQNFTQYTYMGNQTKNIDELLKIYCGIWDEMYQTGTDLQKSYQKPKNKNSHQTDYINQQSSNNHSSINSNNANISGNMINHKHNKSIKFDQNTSFGSVQKNHSFLLPNPGNNGSVSFLYSNIANNTNNSSNMNMSKISSHKQKPIKQKMQQLSNSYTKSSKNSPNPSNTSIPQNNTSTNLNFIGNGNRNNFSSQIGALEINNFGQSCFSYSQGQAVTGVKFQIYKFVIGEFGDRVVSSPLRVWVIGFWKISAGFVFLYSTGTWQVNFNLHKQTPNYPHNYDNRQKQKQQAKRHNKRDNQCAIIIDRYGLAWWLCPKKTLERNTITKAKQNLGLQINLSEAFDRNNKKQNIKYTRIDEGYNSLNVKIARKIISTIKSAYIRQFQHIMQPYKYSKYTI